MINIKLPKWAEILYRKYRTLVAYGGRGSSKSHSVARFLILESLRSKVRILCAREYQVSITDSVYKLLADIINEYELDDYFTITQKSIISINGSEFVFKGIRNNINNIKSMEDISICWVEEGQSVSKTSWDILYPTIRAEGSKIIVTFNPIFADDETYKRFIVNTPIDCIVVKVNYDDNPYFPEVLKKEMEFDKANNYEKYLHVWEGLPLNNSEAQVFKGKYDVTDFEEPNVSDIYMNRFFYGSDWGFSVDPTCLIRCFIKDSCLYITHEVGGVGVEMEQLPKMFDKIPGSRKWEILADNARPETINYIARQGFRIKAAKKWKDSVQEGIEYIRSFKKIYIHPRCKKTIEEFKKYSYKVDKNTDRKSVV